MKIRIELSEEGINAAISKLLEVQDSIDFGLRETIEILTQEGADVASGAYGGMAAVDHETSMDHGIIRATGEAVVIAEFGAGDATMPVLFENYPGVDVYRGSYSEQVGSHEYATTGRWHFGGKSYTEVEPRAGLLEAMYYIMANSTGTAMEVIRFD